jgi:selenocysteine-specific elongation factor
MCDRLFFRRTSGPDRIVGGLVLDTVPARGISRRRQNVERVARLAAAVEARDDDAIAAARLDLHGALEAGSGPADIAADIAGGVDAAVLAAMSGATDGPPSLTDIRETAATELRRHATIRRHAASVAAASLVDRLVADGRLVRAGAGIALPGAMPAASGPDPILAAAMDRLERSLSVAAPPSLTLAGQAAACPPAGIRRLEEDGRIVVLEPDLAYATATYERLQATALGLAATAPLTPAVLRDATGTSRKYVMAILEDLDRRGILRRTPDGHRPGPRAPRSAVTTQ